MSKYVIEHDELFECKIAVTSAMRIIRDEAHQAAQEHDKAIFDALIDKRDKLAILLEKLYNLEYAK